MRTVLITLAVVALIGFGLVSTGILDLEIGSPHAGLINRQQEPQVTPPQNSEPAPAQTNYPTAAEIARNRETLCRQNDRCQPSSAASNASPLVYESFSREQRTDLDRCVRVNYPDVDTSVSPPEIAVAARTTIAHICQPAPGEQPWPMSGQMPVAPFLNYHATPITRTQHS